MKVYIRQIRPMFYSPGGQGALDTYFPLGDWEHEDNQSELEDRHKEQIMKDPWASLKFEERYVEYKDVN